MELNEEQLVANDVITRIDMLRYECGYSIPKLAELSEIPESTLKSILSRKMCPKITTIHKLCNAFEISLWQFFLYPNKMVAFSKSNIDLIGRIEKLTNEERQALMTIIEAIERKRT